MSTREKAGSWRNARNSRLVLLFFHSSEPVRLVVHVRDVVHVRNLLQWCIYTRAIQSQLERTRRASETRQTLDRKVCERGNVGGRQLRVMRRRRGLQIWDVLRNGGVSDVVGCGEEKRSSSANKSYGMRKATRRTSTRVRFDPVLIIGPGRRLLHHSTSRWRYIFLSLLEERDHPLGVLWQREEERD